MENEPEQQQQETTTTTVQEQQQQPIVVPPLPRRNQTIPLRARVTSAFVQQHLPAPNKIRTIDECNHIVRSFNNNGIFTKNDLAAYAHNHNHNNKNDDVNDEFSTLATELQRNVENRRRFRVSNLIEFNQNSGAFEKMSASQVNSFCACYDFSMHNLHDVLYHSGLPYISYPTQLVYDSEVVCLRPLATPAPDRNSRPRTFKVMIGLPHKPHPEQI